MYSHLRHIPPLYLTRPNTISLVNTFPRLTSDRGRLVWESQEMVIRAVIMMALGFCLYVHTSTSLNVRVHPVGAVFCKSLSMSKRLTVIAFGSRRLALLKHLTGRSSVILESSKNSRLPLLTISWGSNGRTSVSNSMSFQYFESSIPKCETSNSLARYHVRDDW